MLVIFFFDKSREFELFVQHIWGMPSIFDFSNQHNLVIRQILRSEK